MKNLGLSLSMLLGNSSSYLKDVFANLNYWTPLIGTAAVSGGKIQGTTQGNVGNNLESNGEFTTVTGSWNTDGSCAVTRVDSSTDPGDDSSGHGAIDKWALKLTSLVGGGGQVYKTYSYVIGATYKYNVIGYIPAGGGVSYDTTHLGVADYYSTFDSWAAGTNTSVATSATHLAIFHVWSAAVGYMDAWNDYRQNTVYLLSSGLWNSPNATITVALPQPVAAAAAVPLGLICRYTDSLNYWEVRVSNTSTASRVDTEIVEVVAGAESVKASARVGWSSSLTDQMRITLNGSMIVVEFKKSGASTWAVACLYASATSGLASAKTGVMLYDTAVGRISSYEITELVAPTFQSIAEAFANLTSWTPLIGTAAVSGGKLQGTTQGNVGNNYVANTEITVDAIGWGANADLTVTRRDFATAPDIDPTGGADQFGVELAVVNADPGNIYTSYLVPPYTYIPGAYFRATCRAYSPSGNTAVNAASLIGPLGPGDPIPTTIEGTWQTLTSSVVQPPNGFVPRLAIDATSGGDLAYFDKIEMFRQNTLLLLTSGLWASPNATITVSLPQPASPSVVPVGIIFRYTSPLDYWELRINPNTAGTDTSIVEVVAGVETVRASADCDWSDALTDQVKIVLAGTVCTVTQNKNGAGWGAACAYATMATGLASSQLGLMLYDTALGRVSQFEVTQ
jgi:hypothetical protein